MHITTAAALKRGLEQKCEAVGQGSFASPNACVCEGTVVSHSNTDVMVDACGVISGCDMSPVSAPALLARGHKVTPVGGSSHRM